ncbi:MAG: proprotein convertase P-domain-containing protein, partial [Anaerolineales bacterium]|nr:proprotein convertase P-domain-containing protein [Anaerolineales bacterium]
MIRSFIYFMLLTLGIYSSNLYGFTVQSETVSTNTQSYSGSGAISDINVTVNFTSTYDNGNRYVGFSLISPSGTAVTLKRYDYGSGNTFSNTTFDDEASNQWTSGSVPYTGQYRPYEGSLSVFDGENPNGTWTFVVYNSRSETGSASWSLSISTTSGTGTTSPLGTAHSGSSFSVSSETVSTGTINITDVGTITDINVRVSFTSTYDNGNRYVGFSLISPSGTAVALKRYDYGAGSMFYHTNFDDEASNQWTSGGAAYTSNYRPYEGSLSVFDGESQVGTWTLVVYNSRSETGNIDSWSIFTTTNSST